MHKCHQENLFAKCKVRITKNLLLSILFCFLFNHSLHPLHPFIPLHNARDPANLLPLTLLWVITQRMHNRPQRLNIPRGLQLQHPHPLNPTRNRPKPAASCSKRWTIRILQSNRQGLQDFKKASKHIKSSTSFNNRARSDFLPLRRRARPKALNPSALITRQQVSYTQTFTWRPGDWLDKSGVWGQIDWISVLFTWIFYFDVLYWQLLAFRCTGFAA